MGPKASQSERAFPRLLVHTETGGRLFMLEGPGPWVAGRAEDCQIQILDPMVSRHHLRIDREAEQFTYRDLGGTNPTLVRGRIQRQGVLAPGLILTLGTTSVELLAPNQSPPVELSNEEGTRILEREQLAPAAAELDLEADFPARSLMPALTAEGGVSEAATAGLQVALGVLRHAEGVVLEWEPDQPPRPIASARLGTGGQPVQVAAEVLAALSGCEQATLIRTDDSKQMLLPLGGTPPTWVLLAGPAPDAPAPQTLLAQGKVLAQLLGARLGEVRRLASLNAELGRLRASMVAGIDLILASRRLDEARMAISAAAAQSLPVYFVAPDGTEREALARAVHAQSEVAQGPFVAVHCGMLPSHRADEELFGASRPQRLLPLGARAPAVLRANHGTLFLDAPELLPPAVQERLASVLARGSLLVHGIERELPLSLRLVAAAEQVPAEQRKHGPGLRPALAELLSGVHIDVPALRDHPEDILTLADLMLRDMGPGREGQPRALTAPAQQLLVAYSWPGNVRQLLRVIQHAAARAGQEPIAPRHLPPEIREHDPSAELAFDTLAANERQHILRVLEAVGGSRSKAAKLLGIATSTLYEKLKRFPR